MGTGLDFKHFVIDEKGDIFASARDNRSKIHNFIITQAGRVMEQVNVNFEEITGEHAKRVKIDVTNNYGLVPTYRTRSAYSVVS